MKILNETMKTFHLALIVLMTGLLCVGNAVGQDEKKTESNAARIFEETLVQAKDRDVSTMGLLGFMYANGEGVIQDDKEAVKWFRKAVDLGDAMAMYNLGVMYAKGKGVIEDDKEAVKWYRKAAELGNELAMTHLGFMYVTGEGVIEDAVEAYAWINVTAENGQNQKTAAKLRDNIKKTMTPEQIAEGQKRSREIMKSISKN